ncbi:MAG: Mu-like prophage major head subunit gpT family protein [Planctomycetota bacterium]
MAIIDTGLVLAGARSEFAGIYDAMDKAAAYRELAERIVSTKDVENHRFLGSVPPMREWASGRVAHGVRGERYDITNLKYELTMEIDRDEISDDQTGQIMRRIRDIAPRAAQHKDLLIATLLESGATAGFISYDGITYFNDAHVSGDSGNQDNTLTFNVADAGNVPTVAEMKDIIKLGIQQIMGFKDDKGQPKFMMQSGMAVVVPVALWAVAVEALGATIINNTTNVLANMARLIVMPHLTSAVNVYIRKTDEGVRPFIFQDREPLEIKAAIAPTEQNSLEEFLKEKYYVGARARYAMAYGDWAKCVRVVIN